MLRARPAGRCGLERCCQRRVRPRAGIADREQHRAIGRPRRCADLDDPPVVLGLLAERLELAAHDRQHLGR
jgi:hypothetical protein